MLRDLGRSFPGSDLALWAAIGVVIYVVVLVFTILWWRVQRKRGAEATQ